jgi:predicted SAM-dependent methyltransferase
VTAREWPGSDVQATEHQGGTLKLHIGSGSSPLVGWVNIDIGAAEGVDYALDVRQGLPFSDVALIFAEHFLEHLTLAEGTAFLRECRRALSPAGILRLSTPNLDWVWLTHYKHPSEMSEDEQLFGCLEMNRAFHGWGHQFLYNQRTLTLALQDAGFEVVTPCRYGESETVALHGLERHERHADLADAPSVIVGECSGSRQAKGDFAPLIGPYLRDAEVR